MRIHKDFSPGFAYPLSLATQFVFVVFCVLLATQKLHAENEPNDNMATATVAIINTYNTGSIGDSDKEDWWKITVAEAGNLCLRDSVIESSGSSSSFLYSIYLYDSDGKTLVVTNLSRTSGNTGSRITTGVLPGTYYVRFRLSGYDGSYKFFPEFSAVPEDTLMNDSLGIAQKMELNKTNVGNIGHWNVNITERDKEDWWKITFAEAGNLCLRDSVIESSGSSSSFLYSIYLYDKDGKTLVVTNQSRTSGNTGSRITTGVLPGTYYVRIRLSGYYGSYKIFPEFIPVPEDSIMNDSLEVAQKMELNKTNVGNIGYWNVNISDRDKEDWWKITVTEPGNLCLRDSVIESSGSSSSFLYSIYLYESDGKTPVVTNKSRTSGNTGSRITTGVLPGTYYVRIRLSGYYGSYKIFPEFIQTPKSNFVINRDITNVLFTNKSEQGETFQWLFGDGNSSNEANTSHLYIAPGDYKVQLIAKNIAGSDTSSQIVSIQGVKDFSPKQGGNNGQVTITIIGGGLNANTEVKLTSEGQDVIEGYNEVISSLGALQVTFNLNEKKIGKYSLVTSFPNANPIIKENAFDIVEGEAPKPWVNLSGRSKALFNRWQTYTIEYGNTGNINAEFVPIFITISDPDVNEVIFPDLQIIFNDYVIEKGWESEFAKMPIYFDVDTFLGEALKTRIFPLYLPSIPANFSGSLKMKIKTPNQVKINVWNTEPLMENGQLKSGVENSQLADCIYWAQMEAIANGTVTLVDLFIPGVGCIASIGKAGYSLGNGLIKMREERMKDYLKSPPLTSYFGSFLMGTASLFLDCIGSITNIGPAYELAIGATSQFTFTVGTIQADKDCKKKFASKNHVGQNVKGVTSFDPNEISGPAGYGQERYISGLETAKYFIYFENKVTAGAPAQEVFVVDTLNKDFFEFSSFSFNSVTIADSTFNIPYGQKEFAFDFDMRPKQNIIARCIGSIDTTTGVVNVYFNSLDATTMEQNEDPMAGILLPNVNQPEGEGNVSFYVGIKNVENGDTFSNKAAITFDFNKPIITNTWSNIFDLKAPSSRITDYKYIEENNTLKLYINGEDEGAGIRNYSIYVSVNDSSYVPFRLVNSEECTYQLHTTGSNYKFYSIAVDSLGYVEDIPNIYNIEYISTSNKALNKHLNETLNVFPNPTSGNCTIGYYVSKNSKCEMRIFDMQGRQIAQPLSEHKSAGFHQLNFNYEKVPDGLYIIRFINDYQNFTIKSILSK